MAMTSSEFASHWLNEWNLGDLKGGDVITIHLKNGEQIKTTVADLLNATEHIRNPEGQN